MAKYPVQSFHCSVSLSTLIFPKEEHPPSLQTVTQKWQAICKPSLHSAPSSRGPEILLTLGLELASSFSTPSSQSSLTAQTVGRRHYGLSCSVGSHSESHSAICPPPPPDLHGCLQKFFYRTQTISPLTWLSLAWSPPAHPCSSW